MSKPANSVLVIDDEPQIRRFVGAGLELHGYTVKEANTGAAGLSAAAHMQPDVIVLDLGLPDMGGMEVLTRIRGWSTMPVIVMSAVTAEVQKVAALDAGADDYVTKPFDMNELLARLRVALRDRRPGPDQPGHALAATA